MTDCREKCAVVIPEGQKMGWCERHQCKKTASWAKLCQRDRARHAATISQGQEPKPSLWIDWEEGRGPGQARLGASTPSLPSTPRMLWNLANAVAAFASDILANGMNGAIVDETEYQRRLEICNGCVPPDGFRVENRCHHKGCGCFLSIKARGRAWTCPIGKWDSPAKQISEDAPEAKHDQAK